MMKRGLEFEGVGLVEDEAVNVTVHGILKELSPIKKSRNSTCNYYNGVLTDGEKEMRLVGFDCDNHAKLSGCCSSKEAVVIKKCQIKKARQNNDLELLVKSSTIVEKSPKKFKVETVVGNDSRMDMTVNKLWEVKNYQAVSVVVKVMRVDDEEKLTNGKCKQDVIVADSTGSITCVLWEGDIGMMEEKRSYRLQNVCVNSFRGNKFLSVGKETCKVSEVSDIGDVDINLVSEDGLVHLENVEVIGVQSIMCYRSCISCKGKVEEVKENTARCSKCAMLQKLDRCGNESSCRVVVSTQDNSTTKLLNVFSTIIEEIVCSNIITDEALLCAAPFSLSYNHKDVICSVKRKTM